MFNFYKKNPLVKTTLTICIIALISIGGFIIFNQPHNTVADDPASEQNEGDFRNPTQNPKITKSTPHPMAITSLRQQSYPGGNFTIEQTLSNGTNYQQHIASYQSEGLKIYGLLTIPTTPKPEGGYPAILFIHGYIPPEQYSTINNYPTYQATLARSGMVTFKPDLRGHGNSEGAPVSAHYSEKYTIDTLNALAYLKNNQDVNPNRIGYWGHSNGGEIGLRTILITKDIKAASFWAGVVGSYQDMFETHIDNIPFLEKK